MRIALPNEAELQMPDELAPANLISPISSCVFVYKLIAVVLVPLLYCMTIHIIRTQSSTSMKEITPFFLYLHTVAFLFDFAVLVSGIDPLFPLIAFSYHSVFASKLLVPLYYPLMCLVCSNIAVAMESILRRRIYVVSRPIRHFFAHIPDKLGYVIYTFPLPSFITALIGVVPFEVADAYYRKHFPQKSNLLLADPSLGVYYVPSINAWVYVHASYLLFAGLILSIEFGVAVSIFIHSMEANLKLISLQRTRQQRDAYICVMLQFLAPVASLGPALLSGYCACFEVDIPYETFNAIIPVLFSCNSYWMTSTCIYFNSSYKSYFVRRLLFWRKFDDKMARIGGHTGLGTGGHSELISVRPFTRTNF